MDDIQIIIDGVNIKNCKRRIGKDNFCRYYKRPCAENNYNCIWKKYLRKEQECEELKKEIKHYKQIAQYHGNLSVKYTNKSAKLKQTLTEIKEIAENVQSFVGRIDIEDELFEQIMEQILQKINEVENEYNG